MRALISYDDTPNDQDALTLAGILAAAGAELTLAYVRHAVQECPDHEALEHTAAEALLRRGASRLEEPDVGRRIIVSGSTGAGLAQLATSERADVVVLGSDYRTPPGRVVPGRSAQSLLERGTAALALAPAGYRSGAARIDSIGLLSSGDPAVLETASHLAECLDAIVVASARNVDLLVVGSRAEAPAGRLLLSSASLASVEEARCPVLVLARGVPLVPSLSLV